MIETKGLPSSESYKSARRLQSSTKRGRIGLGNTGEDGRGEDVFVEDGQASQQTELGGHS